MLFNRKSPSANGLQPPDSFVLGVGWRSLGLLCLLCLSVIGCAPGGEDAHHNDEFVPEHTPRSLMDLSTKIQERVAILKASPSNAVAKSELADLISWSAEVAADSDISEERWNTIYEHSEQLRLAVDGASDDWNIKLDGEIARLSQLAEEGWASLEPRAQRERYIPDEHCECGEDHNEELDEKMDDVEEMLMNVPELPDSVTDVDSVSDVEDAEEQQ